MAENTKIEWATHSFSPWIGCSRVHAGCQNCYAEAMAGRLGVKWGPNGTRRRTAESTWKQVEKWQGQAYAIRDARPFGKPPDRPRVFPSLCDPFEDWRPGGDADSDRLRGWRADFFALIDRCPNLDFLLLTKRPENIRRMWPCAGTGKDAGADNYLLRDNVWLLYSASDQASLDAGLPHLLACRDLAPVIGLSLEPLIGPVPAWWAACDVRGGIGWVIVGGESGPRHRPMDISWLESIADQCESAGVPLFVKQDCGGKPGQQGRIPDRLWQKKEFPVVA